MSGTFCLSPRQKNVEFSALSGDLVDVVEGVFLEVLSELWGW